MKLSEAIEELLVTRDRLKNGRAHNDLKKIERAEVAYQSAKEQVDEIARQINSGTYSEDD